MRFLYEKQSRRFCLAVLILILFVGIGSVLQSRIYGSRIQSMMIEHDTAVISSLLEQLKQTSSPQPLQTTAARSKVLSS